jgi:hypothetical protein
VVNPGFLCREWPGTRCSHLRGGESTNLGRRRLDTAAFVHRRGGQTPSFAYPRHRNPLSPPPPTGARPGKWCRGCSSAASRCGRPERRRPGGGACSSPAWVSRTVPREGPPLRAPEPLPAPQTTKPVAGRWGRDGLRVKGRLAATYSPTGLSSSTIRAAGLNGRVRDGNGCVPRAMATNHHSGAAHPSACPREGRAGTAAKNQG